MVIADDTEQMSICLRYVFGCSVKERFLQFIIDVHKRTDWLIDMLDTQA